MPEIEGQFNKDELDIILFALEEYKKRNLSQLHPLRIAVIDQVTAKLGDLLLHFICEEEK